MLNISALATELKDSSALILEIEKTLESNAVEPTLGIVKSIYIDYIKGKKGVTGAKGATSYLAHLAADQARNNSQPQLGLMQNMQTLRGQLVEQFDPVTSSVADDVNAELVRRTVAKTVASNLKAMPKTQALLDQLGNFTSQQSTGFAESFNPEQSMAMFLGEASAYSNPEASSSFLLSASTTNLLAPSPESVEVEPEVETAIAQKMTSKSPK